MKVLSIGDIHGIDLWKDLTHGSINDFLTWKIAVDAGIPADDDFWKEMPFMQYDRIIFVGDYTDSFTVSNVLIKKNLLDIIYFKKALPDKVVTLLGNHDVQYIVPNQLCSGFRSEMAIDLQQIFRENRELFKIAHLEKSREIKWLWTHAGVTSGWVKEAKDYLLKPDRFHALHRPNATKEIDEMLNWLWESNASVLYQADGESGGYCRWAGPLWVRTKMLNKHHLKSHGNKDYTYTQVVGHTPVKDFRKHKWDESKKEYTIYYIDCLSTTQKGLILEI